MTEEMKCPIVWANPHKPTPPKPYGVMQMIARVEKYRDPIVAVDDKNRYHVREIEQTVSFSFRGKNEPGIEHANELAEHTRRWLELWGKYILEDNNLVIKNISGISDRTVFLVDSFDYKVGFDVTFRTMQTDEYRRIYQDKQTGVNYDIIETVVVNDHTISKEDKN